MVSRIAVFTIAHNEHEFLPHWLNYYESSGDCLVLDHASDPPVVSSWVRRLYHDSIWDYRWIEDTIEEVQHELLKKYDIVVFSTPDEFLVPCPLKYRTFREYINMGVPDIVYANMGYHVMDMTYAPVRSTYPSPIKELPIRWDQQLMLQRSHWAPDKSYGKPLISRVPLEWGCGLHNLMEPQEHARDKDLILIHLARIDYIKCRERHALTKRFQHKNDDAYNSWFYDNLASYNCLPEPIPPHYRTIGL